MKKKIPQFYLLLWLFLFSAILVVRVQYDIGRSFLNSSLRPFVVPIDKCFLSFKGTFHHKTNDVPIKTSYVTLEQPVVISDFANFMESSTRIIKKIGKDTVLYKDALVPFTVTNDLV